MNSQRASSSPQNIYESALRKLADDALQDISRMPAPILQFCGPISTGGFGNAEENMAYLQSAIESAKERGISVFDQLSYERSLDAILKDYQGYDYPILDSFYAPLLKSGKIGGLIFLPLWQSSVGSRWEHDLAVTLGIPMAHPEKLLIEEIVAFYRTLH